MRALSEMSMLMYRFLFVLPLAASVGATATAFLGRLRDAPRRMPKAPLPHPIDEEYGIETSGVIGFKQLRSGKKSDVYTVSYGGSQPSIVRRALAGIPGIERSTFLDLGCGKGRALAVASEFPFRDVVGVELAPFLADIARANAAAIGRRFPGRPPIRVFEGDALATRLPEGQVVLYLFHPFFKALMKKLVAGIEADLRAGRCGKVFVVYYNPVYGDVFDASPLFRRVAAEEMRYAPEELGAGASYHDESDAVVVWQSAGGDMAAPQPGAHRRIAVPPPGWKATVLD